MPEGPLMMPILSGSMRPIIPLDSKIIISPCDASDCRVGDVAVYLEGDKLVAHRILWFFGGRNRGWFFAKGDANPHGRISSCRHIKGRVIEVHLPEETADDKIVRDPFSLSAAQQSRHHQIRNIVLALPRYLRDRLLGNRNPSDSSENGPSS